MCHEVDNTCTLYIFNKGKPFDPDFGTGAPSGAGSHFAIYPGTKWCGYENIAKDMEDLGIGLTLQNNKILDQFKSKLLVDDWMIERCFMLLSTSFHSYHGNKWDVLVFPGFH